jgi:hypothetical protein
VSGDEFGGLRSAEKARALPACRPKCVAARMNRTGGH